MSLIALDARWLQTPLHGIARYCLNLLAALPLGAGQSLAVIYNRADFDLAGALALRPELKRPELIWVEAGIPIFAKGEALAMTALLRRLKPALLHVPAYWKPYACPCPWLMTIHDLIHLEEGATKYRLYYAWLRRHLHRAAGVLTVSQAAADSIKAWCGLSADVTYPGVEERYRPGTPSETEQAALQKLGLRPPYFLYIGNPKPHKRAELVLQASRSLVLPHHLVSLGIPASEQREHLALNSLPDDLLPALYQGASGLLLPSRQEGFGLPGAEATACACPVLATDIPVLREVVPAAQHLPSDDVDAWSQAMATLLEQRPVDLTEAAAHAAERFACRELGQRTAAVYGRALAATK